jgi:TM2 domain-containing membrane protein YozV
LLWEIATITVTPKSKAQFLPLLLLLLLLFLGSCGAHRYYARKIGTGILMILTLGGLVVWTLGDLIFIATGNFRDGKGNKIVNSRDDF